jgi:hypothetical protein
LKAIYTDRDRSLSRAGLGSIVRYQFNLLKEDIMATLKPGDKAPLFTLLDQDGKKVKLSDFTGAKLLLYFYSKAGTSG